MDVFVKSTTYPGTSGVDSAKGKLGLLAQLL